jgi:hypothetical protein
LAILGHFVKSGAAAQPDCARAITPDVNNIGVLKFGEFAGAQVRYLSRLGIKKCQTNGTTPQLVWPGRENSPKNQVIDAKGIQNLP